MFREVVRSFKWNIIQGLNNVSIKNKIADHISQYKILSDVCKLIKQVRHEMENREAFTGISAEPEESKDEIHWKQRSYSQPSRGRGYSTRSYQQSSNYQCNIVSSSRTYNQSANKIGKKVSTGNNSDLQCMLCELKGHKVTNCRKLARAKELL